MKTGADTNWRWLKDEYFSMNRHLKSIAEKTSVHPNEL
jgi:hypothetical protein